MTRAARRQGAISVAATCTPAGSRGSTESYEFLKGDYAVLRLLVAR